MISFSDASRRSLIFESAPLQYSVIFPSFFTMIYTEAVVQCEGVNACRRTYRHALAIIVEIEYVQQIEHLFFVLQSNRDAALRTALNHAESEMRARDPFELTSNTKPKVLAAETRAFSSGDCA